MPNKEANNGKESVEQTLSKIAALLGDTAKKDDIDSLKTQIINFTTSTNEEISKLKHSIEAVETKSYEQQDQIISLQADVQTLKQTQLRNNISVAGIPEVLLASSKPSDVIMNIASKLGIVIAENQFNAHSVANNRFVIAHFHDFEHKRSIMSKLRIVKKLCVRDLFSNESSNDSQIFVNDHLTPYFNKLYLMARNAKREGKVFSATSYSGRIHVRKFHNDLPILITSEQQLNLLINMESIDLDSDNSQFVESNNASTSTKKNDKQSPKKRSGKNQKKTEKRSRNTSPSKSPNQSDNKGNSSKRNRTAATHSANTAA